LANLAPVHQRRLETLRALVFGIAILLALLGSCHSALAATKIKIGALKFGSFSWLLDTIQQHGFDKAEDIDLDVVPLASTEATRVGLLSHSLDLIVTDWLWVSRERSSGADFTFSAFSSELGALMVPPNSAIKSLDDLKGKRLGVAGGPLDKSWLMLVAYTLRVAFFDLRRETTPVFGAPPLLAEKVERGDIDAVLEYWPYAARLEGKGFKQLIAMGDLPLELGAHGQVAMVGYVFSESWATSNDQAIRGFLSAAAKANQLLATSDEEWRRLRPLMQVENDAEFESLKKFYREGIPNRSGTENEDDAKILYQFLRVLGGEELFGPATDLAPGTFWKEGTQ
jgi:NitT/TauT family transport system substrate-binding protein